MEYAPIGLAGIVGALGLVVAGFMAFARHLDHERCRRGGWQ